MANYQAKEVVGAAVLVISNENKKAGKFDTASGIKIYPARSDGSPDFSAPSQLIWFTDINILKAGAHHVPAYLNPPYEAKKKN